MRVHLRLIDTTDGFASLRDRWDDVLACSRHDNPFLSHEWLMSWWEAYGGEHDRLHIVCCCRDSPDDVVGILPLYFQHTSGLVKPRTLRYLGQSQVGPGCIATREEEDVVFREFASGLFTTRCEWDVLTLQNVDSDSAFLASLLTLFGRKGRPVRHAVSGCPPIELPNSWDEFLSTLSRNGRRSARRLRLRLESAGRVEVESIMESADLHGALQDVARLFESSMRRKFGRPYVMSERHLQLLTAAAQRFLALGWLRLFFLEIDGQRVAYKYEIRHGDTMFALQTGFDTDWESFGVGEVASGYAIESAITEGCHFYDFGTGWAERKTRWGAEGIRPLSHISLYGQSAVASVVATRDVAARWSKHALKPLVPEAVRARRDQEISWRQLQSL
jgi:CelD/BcsL family acetyltransferase involved in cellulose biosynthesis